MESRSAVSERSRFMVQLRLTGIPEVAQRQWPVLLKGGHALSSLPDLEHGHHPACHPYFTQPFYHKSQATFMNNNLLLG